MKIKLTKGELKRQRDALKQYERYLPTLQLKKQQLQMEILHQLGTLEARHREEEAKSKEVDSWIGLLSDGFEIAKYVLPSELITEGRNIAGVEIRVFKEARFNQAEYDLFSAPLWVDGAIAHLRTFNSLCAERHLLEANLATLRHELRVTTQRVNLFEKVKIPEAEEAIRLIKIYIGDQMSNAVGRSKIAKRKIEEASLAA